MPGPDPRTKQNRERGEKKLPKEPEKRPEAPIGALGGKKKIARTPAGTKQDKSAEDIVRAAVRDRGKDQSLAKGGRAMYKSGMRVCKLAKRGKGRAYGKNS
jgi:hypothetical protein